jgi:subtilisin family serine protease
MASPHVAGVAALYLEKNKSAKPSQVKAGLVGGSLVGKLKYIGKGSPNKLLNTILLTKPLN